jgi:hypothetical protein
MTKAKRNPGGAEEAEAAPLLHAGGGPFPAETSHTPAEAVWFSFAMIAAGCLVLVVGRGVASLTPGGGVRVTLDTGCQHSRGVSDWLHGLYRLSSPGVFERTPY